MAAADGAGPEPGTGRLIWLDAWRGLAVLWMIETHCFNAFRDPAWSGTGWFPWLNYANGLVAPTFLFIAGLVLGLGWNRAWECGRPSRVGPRLLRLGGILALGTLLHFPFVEWISGTLPSGDWLVRWLCTVDILGCLAVSLALLVCLGRWCPGPRSFDAGCILLAVLAVGSAPWLALRSGAGALAQIGWSWCNTQHGALFPLLPWLGFVAVGAWAARWRGKWGPLSAAALACWVASRLVALVPGGSFAALPSSVRPDFFLERLGWIFLLGAVCARVGHLGKWPVLTFAGRHSLLLYVVHLELIYGFLVPWLRAWPPAWAVVAAWCVAGVGSLLLVRWAAAVPAVRWWRLVTARKTPSTAPTE